MSQEVDEALPEASAGDLAPSSTSATKEEPEEAPSYPTRKFQGWVDTSAYYDNNDASQAGALGFNMAQVGLRMSHAINENYGGFVQVNGFSTAGSLNVRAREAYGYYEDGDFKLLAGKFYAPIGFELADPPDLYQFSNSLVFANLIPTELVGIMGAYKINDTFDVKVYTSGPWDDDAAALSVSQKNVGGRFGVSLGDLGGVGLSGVGGVQGDGITQRAAIDLDAALTPAEGLLIGAEFNVNLIRQFYGTKPVTDVTTGAIIKNEKSEFVMPMGFLVMANYAFTDLFNLTLRYDMVMDADTGDGVKEASGAPLFGPVPVSATKSEAVTLSSVTVGPNFHLTDGWDVFTEVRYDMASEDVFLVDGKAKNGMMSGAVELIYQF
jgi:hypothetical protein